METPSVTFIGKYEVLAELGRGGMGVVYRAEDKNIGREVAIKTLTDATPELRQRFLVEARSGVLNHQNIVTVYDFGEQDGNPYIVMEYLHGESLEKMLRGSTPSLVDKLDIMRQVCEGLGYAHSKGVVHRDIKPANIMVQPNGHVKIVDFGIARLESSSGHTQTGAVIGTFHYISPERLKGQASDGRADIWAAGVVLYQLLTGALPFGGEDISALHKVVNEPFLPLSHFVPDYPEALEQVMSNALAKNPEERYSTAEEMAADLEAINETLKQARVGEVLAQAKVLLEQGRLTVARPMLLDLQRLDPQNNEIKRLLRETQERLARQQKSEQVRQTLNLAEEAVLSQRYGAALELYQQASRLDPAATGLIEKIEHVRGLKEKLERIAALQQQARDARQRSDLATASSLIEQALQLDERNTDLRNERAGILQEIERQARDGNRRRLLLSGREHLAHRSYTQAIHDLRQALDLDPTDAEAQRAFQDATARQEEERRRKVIEQIVAEIQDQIFRNDLDRALQLVQRALERLPTEAALLRLRAEIEKRRSEDRTRRLIETTSLRVQELFHAEPQEALAAVQAALHELPGNAQLLELQGQVVAQLKRANLEGLRTQYMKQAQGLLEASRYDEAIAVLETAKLDCGEAAEVTYLLEHARAEKSRSERQQAAAQALSEAQARLSEEDLEGALAVLRPAAQETGDPAVEHLRQSTQDRLDEAVRRLGALVERLKTLGDSDPAQALQLLAGQPAVLQQHSEVKAVRGDLQARVERGRALDEAIRQSQALLATRDLHGGLEALESVRRAYGDSTALNAAAAQYKQAQARTANEMVGESIAEARQFILGRNGQNALEVLHRTRYVLELADAGTQADWNRLSQEASRISHIKLDSTGAVPVFVQRKGLSPMIMALIGVGVLLLAGALFAVLHSRAHPGEGGAGASFIQLNASPFAEVLSITAADGSKVGLPPGSHTTPLRIDGIPEGSYTVVFKGPDGTMQNATCDLATDHMCSATLQALGDSQIDEILAGKP